MERREYPFVKKEGSSLVLYRTKDFLIIVYISSRYRNYSESITQAQTHLFFARQQTLRALESCRKLEDGNLGASVPEASFLSKTTLAAVRTMLELGRSKVRGHTDRGICDLSTRPSNKWGGAAR